MFIIRDKHPSFEEVAGHVVHSVIAIAVGTSLEDGSPNIVGTGFAVGWAEHFATCWHVAEVHDTLAKLSESELKKKGLKDADLRVALRREKNYVWRKIEPKTWFRAHDKSHDICMYRIIGVAVPPLSLYQEQNFPWGAEVGIIGFPMGNVLQGTTLRPYLTKTVISGGLEIPLDDKGTQTSRLALATTVAGGFSGGPVFSATDGQVMGMVASKVIEAPEGVPWPAGISLAVMPTTVRQALEGQLSTSTTVIKDSLRKHLP